MKQQNLRQFVFRLSPLFAVLYAFIMVTQSWETLVKGYHSKPILLRGLGGFNLSVLGVEIGVILFSSLVVGIGVTLIFWMFLQSRTEAKHS